MSSTSTTDKSKTDTPVTTSSSSDTTHVHVYTDPVSIAKKPPKKKPTTTVAPKALPVITEDEVGRVIDLGLGRGVDATDSSPWLHKSSFQVRNVTIDNIIGTEEGGSMQSYEREVSSVTTQQTDLKASVALPQAPVNLGLEGEQSRSVTTTRKAIGKRVVNRTISFASQFDDLPQSSSKSEATEDALKETSAPRVVYADSVEKREAEREQQHIFTFEERLSKWILERIIHRYELAKNIEDRAIPPEIKLIKGVNPLDDISSYLNAVDRDQAKQIVGDCSDFVRHFRITHYVNSISLGAAQYRILSETEYYNQVSAKGTFGFEAIANLVLSERFSKKTTTKASDLREIGKIVKEKVARGTYDEAVIGIGILPIHQLIKLRFLHLALRQALLDYISMQGDTSSGPFLLMAGDNDIFLKVNEGNGYSLEGTRQAKDASLFFIIPSDTGDHPYEFLISWQGGDHQKQLRRVPSTFSQGHSYRNEKMMKYLDAHVSVLGRNSGPLHLKNHVEEENARFSLRSRLHTWRSAPVDLREWVSGKDRFFVKCSRRARRIDGYFAMKRARRGGIVQAEYTSACVSSIKHHNEVDTFMLFSLISPKNSSDGSATSLEHNLTDQFDEFIGQPQRQAVGTRDMEPRIDEAFDTLVGEGHKLNLKDVPEPGKQRVSSGLEMTQVAAAPH